jgi:hypothetical protein
VAAITFGWKILGPLDQVTRPVAIQRGATVCFLDPPCFLVCGLKAARLRGVKRPTDHRTRL